MITISVSVSSSDRVVMQVKEFLGELIDLQCFSILIGSGGDASKDAAVQNDKYLEFQYPHRIGW